jgi:uncharacterized protein (DUF169 family)
MADSAIETLLGAGASAVAISFVDNPPADVARVAAAEPAGCGYWRRASEGDVFYTTADDHKGCPVGAHTHNVPLSAAEQQELMGLVGTMVSLSYIRMEEVPSIPTRKTPLRTATYAPLSKAPVVPDVVLVRGNARQLMLLAEASQLAGIAGTGATMGRPTCAVLPEAANSSRTAASFGCVGNRVYTGAGENDAYFAIPGDKLTLLEEKLATIVRANEELEKFHRARVSSTSAGPSPA